MEARESSPVPFALVLALIVILLSMARAAFPSEAIDPVRAAIAEAVAARLGGDAIVTVTALRTTVKEARTVVAAPEPGARTGAPARFVLFAGGARVGMAVATVHVSARHVRSTRAIQRDEAIDAADVEQVEAPLRNQPIRRVPPIGEVLGARARRSIAAGEAITTTVMHVRPLVKSGDAVSVSVRIGAVHAQGRGVASGSGHVGDVIGVVNTGTRRPRKARITGPAAVEIVQ